MSRQPGKTKRPRSPRKPSRLSRRGQRRPVISPPRAARAPSVLALEPDEIDALRDELEKSVPAGGRARWNADPEDAQRAVAKLVLTLMEFLRKLLERQAIRRMERRTLTAAETESIGLALMRLEETIRQIGARFGLTPDDLNLDLGPLGRLT